MSDFLKDSKYSLTELLLNAVEKRTISRPSSPPSSSPPSSVIPDYTEEEMHEATELIAKAANYFKKNEEYKKRVVFLKRYEEKNLNVLISAATECMKTSTRPILYSCMIEIFRNMNTGRHI